MTGERLDQLELGPMVLHNTVNLGTAFIVLIDARGRGVTTGISSYDRAQTILAAVDPRTHLEDLARPGHVFLLRSRPDDEKSVPCRIRHYGLRINQRHLRQLQVDHEAESPIDLEKQRCLPARQNLAKDRNVLDS